VSSVLPVSRPYFENDGEWCSKYGFTPPPDHICVVGVCFEPFWDGQIPKEGTEMAWDDDIKAGHAELKVAEVNEDSVCKSTCARCRAEGKQLPAPTLASLEDFQEKARRLIYNYVAGKLEITDKHVTFAEDEVYVVWFSKTLQNWKAMLSTTLPDGMYYEVTYDGDKQRTYIDAYKKFDNVTIPD
jgi:hypothetical protein